MPRPPWRRPAAAAELFDSAVYDEHRGAAENMWAKAERLALKVKCKLLGDTDGLPALALSMSQNAAFEASLSFTDFSERIILATMQERYDATNLHATLTAMEPGVTDEDVARVRHLLEQYEAKKQEVHACPTPRLKQIRCVPASPGVWRWSCWVSNACGRSKVLHRESKRCACRSTSVVAQLDRTQLDGKQYKFRSLQDDRTKASRDEVKVNVVDNCCVMMVALKQVAGQRTSSMASLASASDEACPPCRQLCSV